MAQQRPGGLEAIFRCEFTGGTIYKRREQYLEGISKDQEVVRLGPRVQLRCNVTRLYRFAGLSPYLPGKSIPLGGAAEAD